MIMGSRVRTRLVTYFENLDFVGKVSFPLLKNSEPMKSGVTGYEFSTRGDAAKHILECLEWL